jgi:hypothetical protein
MELEVMGKQQDFLAEPDVIYDLQVPFSSEDIEWRIGSSGKKKDGKPWATVLAYITNRGVMNRLDEVLGPANWWDELEYNNVASFFKHTLHIRIKGEWVSRSDVAPTTNYEAIKGGASDAMKRCAVKFGIGRYLYDIGRSYAIISETGKHYDKVKFDHSYIPIKWDEPKLPDWALPRKSVHEDIPDPVKAKLNDLCRLNVLNKRKCYMLIDSFAQDWEMIELSLDATIGKIESRNQVKIDEKGKMNGSN